MPKKPKKLTPEEEAAKAEEERLAVRDAYMSIYREQRSQTRRGRQPPLGVSTRGEFPLPPLPCRTHHSPDKRAPRVTALSKPQAQAVARAAHAEASEGRCEAKSDGALLCLCTPQPRGSGGGLPPVRRQHHGAWAALSLGARRLTAAWWEKPGTLFDELAENLVLPATAGHPKALIAELAHRVWERHAPPGSPRSESGDGPLEVLIHVVLTCEGPDVDRLFAWGDAPPPWADDDQVVEQWSRYRADHPPHGARNPAVFREVALACAALGAADGARGTPEEERALRRWAKLVGAIGASSARRMPVAAPPVLHKRLWGVPAQRLQDLLRLTEGQLFVWTCPGSAARSEEAAEQSAGSRRGDVVIRIHNCGDALDLTGVSQYPAEEESVIPPLALLEVARVAPGESPAAVEVVYRSDGLAACGGGDFADFRIQVAGDLRACERSMENLRAELAGPPPAPAKQSVWFVVDDADAIDADSLLSLQSEKQVAGAIGKGCKCGVPGKAAEEAPPSGSPGLETLALLLEKEYRAKEGDVLDELLENFRTPAPAKVRRKDALQRLAVAAHCLKEKPTVQTGLPDANYAELLVMWLYTVHGANIDEVMGFQVPPFPDDSKHPQHAQRAAAWAAYIQQHQTENWDVPKRLRNGAIFCDINWAMRCLGSGQSDAAAVATVKKWVKYISLLLALSSQGVKRWLGCEGGGCSKLLYRGFGGQGDAGYQAQRGKQKGEVIEWAAFSSCALDRHVSVSYIDGSAANAQPRPGKAFMFHVRGGFAGLPLWCISEYPAEEEQLVPPMSRFVVADTTEDEGIVESYRKELRQELEGKGEPADAIESAVGNVAACVVELEYDGCLGTGRGPFAKFCEMVVRDGSRSARRLRIALQAVRRREKPSPLQASENALQAASEALSDDSETMTALFKLPHQKAVNVPIIIEVVEALRVALHPGGSEARVHKETLELLATGAGAKPPERNSPRGAVTSWRERNADSLISRMMELTAVVTVAEDLPDETGTKMKLQNFVSSKETRPEAIRQACSEAGLDDIAEAMQDIAAWLRTYHRYACRLIDKVRAAASSKATPIEKGVSMSKLPPIGKGK